MAARRKARLPRLPSREVRQRYAPRADRRAADALARVYVQILRMIHVKAMVHLTPLLAARQDSARQDAAPKVTIKSVRQALTGEMPKLKDLVARTAAQMDRANRTALAKIPGINPTKIVGGDAVVQGFRDKAVGLIVTLESKYLKDLAETLEKYPDLHVKDLAKKIEDRFGVSESRAKFWARDQTLKLNGDLTRQRMKNAGIARYIWTTSNDDRVRGNPDGPYADAEFSHWAREGKIFSFDDPPEDGHPGEAYNCRCVQFPVLDEPEEKELGAREEPPPERAPAREEPAPPRAAPPTPPEETFGGVTRGISEESLDFSREGYREPLTVYEGVARELINAIATGEIPPPGARTPLPPIRIDVHPPGVLASGKTLQLVDGRHRLQAAQRAGATLIRAELVKRGARGAILKKAIRNIPVPRQSPRRQ